MDQIAKAVANESLARFGVVGHVELLDNQRIDDWWNVLVLHFLGPRRRKRQQRRENRDGRDENKKHQRHHRRVVLSQTTPGIAAQRHAANATRLLQQLGVPLQFGLSRAANGNLCVVRHQSSFTRGSRNVYDRSTRKFNE